MAASTRLISVEARLSQRIAGPWRGPRKATTKAVASGTISKNRRWVGMRNLRELMISYQLPHQGHQKHGQAEHHRQGVELHQPVLDRAEDIAEQPRDLPDDVHQAVHHV